MGWRAPRARPGPQDQRRRTNQREDRSSLSRKIKEKVKGVVKVKHRATLSRSQYLLNLNFKSKFFGCIWKMCAFSMFHPRWILASNLSIVPFSLELSGIRLICASSLRFTEGFCMESIKYEQR